MLRNLFGQVLSALVLGGLLVGWWMAADRDFSVMANQAVGVFMWAGETLKPLFDTIFDRTGAGQEVHF